MILKENKDIDDQTDKILGTGVEINAECCDCKIELINNEIRPI